MQNILSLEEPWSWVIWVIWVIYRLNSPMFGKETIGTARGCGVGSVNPRELRSWVISGVGFSGWSFKLKEHSVIFSPDAKQFFIILNVLACFGHRNGDPVSGSCFRPRRGREVQNARRPGWSTFQGWLDLHMTLILKTVPSWTNLQGYLQRCRISSLCLVVACWCYSQLNWCTCCWHCWQESRFVKSDSAKALHFSIFRFSWMLNKPCNKLKHLTISTALDWNCWHMFS